MTPIPEKSCEEIAREIVFKYVDPELQLDCVKEIIKALLEKQKVIDEMRVELDRLQKWASDLKIGERINYRKRYEEILESKDIDVSENRKLLEENSELKEQIISAKASAELQLASDQETISSLRLKLSGLLEAMERIAPIVCSAKCPSVWVTAEGRKHSEECKEAQEALAKFRGGV